ncbi:hypothetical protein HHK36_024571 [Tetracentron sinense]|uniref:Uncharacterized protein n=1 Tax=Tetracentron sinense TaxID=13715 RepID=A0A834YL48_TETSI|nr:hypothetical protein HHK36_024571 [Tetracentron sinense]
MRKPSFDKHDTNKGAWSKQEDQKLIDYIRANGEGCWRSLPQSAGLLRCGKSCRLRWTNYLRPDLKRGNFAEDEEDLIIKLHALLGNRHNLTRPRKERVSGSATLSESKNQASEPCLPLKSHGDKDQVTDGTSCLEDDTCGLPDLNLALAFTIPSPSLTLVEEKQLHMESKVAIQLERGAPSPTLLLFV